MTRFQAAALASLCLMLRETPARPDPPLGGVSEGLQVVDALGEDASPLLSLSSSDPVSVLWKLNSSSPPPPPEMQIIAPGIGRTTMSPSQLNSWMALHPEFARVESEASPPLHALLDKAGEYTQAINARRLYSVDGTGVLVGVADTGLDVTDPDFRDEKGRTRVAWLLDLSKPPLGKYGALEQRFGKIDDRGNRMGAIYDAVEIDRLLNKRRLSRVDEWTGPTDEDGHGTHVTSIAAGNGQSTKRRLYVGMAPKAQILFARVTPRGAGSKVLTADLVQAVGFLFDRAQTMKMPVVVNMSLGTDYGPHDGTTLWEQALASFVGPETEKQGRALVAAAGNTGSVTETHVHQSVYVPPGGTMRVPFRTFGATSGHMRIWVSKRGGASIEVGLDGPDGSTWINPIPEGKAKKYTQRGGAKPADASAPLPVGAGGCTAVVVNGSGIRGGENVPPASRSAYVFVHGNWPAGTYVVTLTGTGTSDLYFETGGNLAKAAVSATAQQEKPGDLLLGFVHAQRSGTINLPATHPNILSVGCTVNHTEWADSTRTEVGIAGDDNNGSDRTPDASSSARPMIGGEVCYFSSAGPNAFGVTKPEIAAPGAMVVASRAERSGRLRPLEPRDCPRDSNGNIDVNECAVILRNYGMGQGTSMSAPMVSGTIALLLQKDPSLTQDRIVSLIQAGAHPFRGPAPYSDQSGPGELDALGALDALEQSQHPTLALPSADKSWLTLATQFAAADGRTPLHAIVQLRTADGEHRANGFDLSRLQPYARLTGARTSITPPVIVQKGPGLFTFDVVIPAGNGGTSLTVGTTFDGKDILTAKTISVATDSWNAEYGSSVRGGCSLADREHDDPGPPGAWFLVLATAPLVMHRRSRANINNRRATSRATP